MAVYAYVTCCLNISQSFTGGQEWPYDHTSVVGTARSQSTVCDAEIARSERQRTDVRQLDATESCLWAWLHGHRGGA